MTTELAALSQSDQQVKDFFQEQLAKKLSTVDQMAEKTAKLIITNFVSTIAHFKSIVSWDSKELALFRELEKHIRDESLSTDTLRRMLSELEQHRRDLSEYNQALIDSSNPEGGKN